MIRYHLTREGVPWRSRGDFLVALAVAGGAAAFAVPGLAAVQHRRKALVGEATLTTHSRDWA